MMGFWSGMAIGFFLGSMWACGWWWFDVRARHHAHPALTEKPSAGSENPFHSTD